MNRNIRETAGFVDAAPSVQVSPRARDHAVRALHVGETSLSTPLASVFADLGWEVEATADVSQAIAAIDCDTVSVVLIDADSLSGTASEVLRCIEHAATRQIATVVIGDMRSPAVGGSPLVTRVPTNTSLDELRGRLAMVERYRTLIQGLERELTTMQALTDRLNDQILEIDDELRLAGRLQRDFLPDLSKPIQGVRFGSIYRPATWVSGDIFDVFRIDEHHTGVYLADAVGHGMAAGLLTMFIKRVIMPKRVHAEGYEVLRPSNVLATLNDTLAEQELPNCQFVSGCYGLIDHRARTFTFARGGHPYPILVTAEGNASTLTVPGTLLGLFPGAEFPEYTVELDPGDKIVLVTDGLEDVVSKLERGERRLNHSIVEFLAPVMRAPLSKALAALEERLHDATGSTEPKDDLTILAFETPPRILKAR